MWKMEWLTKPAAFLQKTRNFTVFGMGQAWKTKALRSAVSHWPITAFTNSARQLLCQAEQCARVIHPGFEL